VTYRVPKAHIACPKGNIIRPQDDLKRFGSCGTGHATFNFSINSIFPAEAGKIFFIFKKSL